MICTLCVDDTPVASANSGPVEGVEDEGDVGNGRLWRTVIIGEQEHRIDMQLIRPYVRVISHGGESSCVHLLLLSNACIVIFHHVSAFLSSTLVS